MKTSPFFTTYSGRRINIAHPNPKDVVLTDIIWALSKVQRFGGHTHAEFYSVAEHSVLVSRLCQPEHAIIGLFHDASEAFIGDVITVLKKRLKDYKAIEDRWQSAIGRSIGIGEALVKLPINVKIANAVALQTERRDLFQPSRVIDKGPEPSELRVYGEDPRMAADHFRSRLRELWNFRAS